MSVHAAKSPSSSAPAFDRARLLAVVEPIARAHGAEVCDVELKNENGWILRIFVEKDGASVDRLSTKDAAIDLELCASIARELSPALDVEDPIPHRYSLEVSSPGVERPLKTLQDFVRFTGHRAKLKLQTAIEGQKVLDGTLGLVHDGVLTIEVGARSYPVPLDDVLSARLVFEFGPAKLPHNPRSAKSGKKRKS